MPTRCGIGIVNKPDKEISRLMNNYWANFAKTGNPNGKGLPIWPTYSLENSHIIEFRPNATAVPIPEPKKERLDLVEKTFEKNNNK